MFDKSTSSITVTLTNPNPGGSSHLIYRVIPVPRGAGTATSFGPYGGSFVVTQTDFPDGFGVETYAKADTRAYGDSPLAVEFATALKGIFGGHWDLDTSKTISSINNGSTASHTHDFTGKYNLSSVDFIQIPDGGQLEIDEAITNKSTRFKITVTNGTLSPGMNLRIRYEQDGAMHEIDQPVDEYDDLPLSALPIFSFNGVEQTAKLLGLNLDFREDVIYEAGIIPTNTGDVRKNVLGKGGEWRNGALTSQAVVVSPTNQDVFTTNPAQSAGGVQGPATSGLLWEGLVFWHWDGPSYHDPKNQYVPRDFNSIRL